jgi:hypothetical protein
MVHLFFYDEAFFDLGYRASRSSDQLVPINFEDGATSVSLNGVGNCSGSCTNT